MAGFAEIISVLDQADRSVTLFINSFSAPWSDAFWCFITGSRVWYPVYLIIAIVMLRRLGWKRGLVAILATVLTIVACDQFSNLIKNAVERLRPCHDRYMVEHGLNILVDKGGLYGFFSAHAANCFGFAAATLVGFRSNGKSRCTPYAWGVFIWAALIGLSRIFVGKHYFGDVLVGAIVGFFLGLIISNLCFRILARLDRRFRDRKLFSIQ